MNCLRLDQVPGFLEALDQAKGDEVKSRESAWLDISHDLCGIKARTMTVRDFVLLERAGSPFLYRMVPTMGDLALFLWVLSPAFDAWSNESGWRKRWIPLRRLESFLHGRKVWKRFDLKRIMSDINAHFKGSTEPYEVPEDSKFAEVINRCFEYKNEMFMDQPASMESGKDSGLCYLGAWFDIIASEYPAFSDDEKFYRLPLPRLFAMLKAIRQRRNPEVPSFNKHRDRMVSKVMKAIRAGAKMEDLISGKEKIQFN